MEVSLPTTVSSAVALLPSDEIISGNGGVPSGIQMFVRPEGVVGELSLVKLCHDGDGEGEGERRGVVSDEFGEKLG
ncbi:hypothetical protein L1887_15185 [Cichorium endivia]|nr:hypothetical protein L1887_15185 [Cichorium endivia]